LQLSPEAEAVREDMHRGRFSAICIDFTKRGQCSHGASCKFFHPAAGQIEAAKAVLASTSRPGRGGKRPRTN
jgi:hypothetical protein